MLDRRAMGRAARPLLDRVGIGQAPTTRLGDLPVGDQQLVAAARALRSAGHVLFLDEPTSSLSPWEAERLFAQMRLLAAQGVAIVYISHRIDEVAAICNRVIVLRDGMVAGSFDEPADKMATIIDTMAPGSVSARFHSARPRGPVLLEVRGLTTGRFGPATFDVHEGEVLGLFGLVGAGRTEIARALIGDLPAEGEVVFRGRMLRLANPWQGYAAGVAYLSENRKAESLFTGQNVRTNITVRAPQDTASRIGWLRVPRLRGVTEIISTQLDIRPRNQNLPIEALSGGNQQKAALGRLLADKLDLFILDEPTHGIDVTAKRDLLNLLDELAGRGKAVIFISSELHELLAVTDRILVMNAARWSESLILAQRRSAISWASHQGKRRTARPSTTKGWRKANMDATGTQNKAGTSLRHSVGGSFWATFGVPLILFLLIIVFSVMSEAFLTSANLINILRQAAVVAIAAVGTTIVLIAGGIDISQGAIIALSGVASVVIVQQYNLPDWIGISIALMLSAFVGLSNGILAERLRIPAFIATLGTAFVVRGILFVYTNGRSIGLGRGKNLTGPLIQWLGKGFVGPIPVPVVLMLLLYLVAALVMARTVWGMHCYAVGSSPRAAEIAGIRVRRLRIQVYTVAGLWPDWPGLCWRAGSAQRRRGLARALNSTSSRLSS